MQQKGATKTQEKIQKKYGIQIYKIILLTSFDPCGGEDGWQALERDEVGRAAHQSCGAPSVRATRLLEEAEEVLSDLC